jgi:hypothetical protein
MTSKSKRELLDAIRPRYLRAKKAGKELMLDEFCAATHYHRKYAIRLLKHGPKPPRVEENRAQEDLPGSSGRSPR